MGGKNSTHYHKHEHYHSCEACRPSSNPGSLRVYNNSPESSSSCLSDCKMIGDEFDSLEQVSQALEQTGLESSNLIIGIDFTTSNNWTGKVSFNGKNLHHLDVEDCLNPYEQAISIIGKTLSRFDEDNKIPCYGFGDVTTGDRQVFSFDLGDRPCHGFEEVLSCYKEIVPHIRLAGPTSFAPIIRNAIRIVNDSGGQYHILLIIADGQVTRSVDTADGQLSPQEKSTIDALVEASKYPLSIVLVGVGDGPWDLMFECDDRIPARDFDNFQFVNFTEIMSKDLPLHKKETDFALNALMEIPAQYKATMSLQLLGRQRETLGLPIPLPPPTGNISLDSLPYFRRAYSTRQPPTFGPSTPHPSEVFFRSLSSTTSSSSSFDRICTVCFSKDKDIALGCGHQICSNCSNELFFCPTCRTQITIKVRLLG